MPRAQRDRMDKFMAERADDKCLAAHFCHEIRPCGPALSRISERFEAGDLVNCHRGASLAELAFLFTEPPEQFPARIGCRGGRGVADDRPPVMPQADPAESCYQIRLAFPVLPGLEAGPQPVSGLDLGLVQSRDLGDVAVVLDRQG